MLDIGVITRDENTGGPRRGRTARADCEAQGVTGGTATGGTVTGGTWWGDAEPAPVWRDDRSQAAPFDLVTVPARPGLEALDVLRLRGGTGPVLLDARGDTLGFLVPAGTAERWDLPGSACAPACGAVGAVARLERPPVAGAGWLVAPEAAAHALVDPVRLRAALRQAVATIEAIDRAR